MGLQKNKPFRSKEFMRFLHSRRDIVGEGCALCDRQWVQLHHFGYDGGKGLKPSDLYLVRLCKICADKNEIKMMALLRAGRYEELSLFLEDAIHNIECWLRHRRDCGRFGEEFVKPTSVEDCF
jgi:hypothetical protein